MAAGRRSASGDGPFKIRLLDLLQGNSGREFREGPLAEAKNKASLWMDTKARNVSVTGQKVVGR